MNPIKIIKRALAGDYCTLDEMKNHEIWSWSFVMAVNSNVNWYINEIFLDLGLIFYLIFNAYETHRIIREINQ